MTDRWTKAEREKMTQQKIVAIFTDGTQLSGLVYVRKGIHLSDALNAMKDKKFLHVTEVKYEGKSLPEFLLCFENVIGIVPA